MEKLQLLSITEQDLLIEQPAPQPLFEPSIPVTTGPNPRPEAPEMPEMPEVPEVPEVPPMPEEKPCTCCQKSCTCGQKPCTCCQKPCTCGQKPCTCCQKPCTCGKTPCCCGEKTNFRSKGKQFYQEDLPYPPVEGIEKNPHYAMLVKQLYSGRVSETTAVTQYFYASCQMRCSNGEIYDALKYISVVEMEHMDLLAQMILCMGGDPTYTCWSRGRGEVYWNGSFVDYSKQPAKILMESIHSEEQAIAAYESVIAKIKCPAAVHVLQRIVLDEKRHLCIFKELYRKLVEQQQRQRCLRA